MLKKTSIVMFAVTLTHLSPAIGDDALPRTLVDMPAPMRGHMLANMRDHLLALTEIQELLGAGEFDKAADVAETRIGMSSLIYHNAAHMAQYMPRTCRALARKCTNRQVSSRSPPRKVPWMEM